MPDQKFTDEIGEIPSARVGGSLEKLDSEYEEYLQILQFPFLLLLKYDIF
jgi:hypothetical protein